MHAVKRHVLRRQYLGRVLRILYTLFNYVVFELSDSSDSFLVPVFRCYDLLRGVLHPNKIAVNELSIITSSPFRMDVLLLPETHAIV